MRCEGPKPTHGNQIKRREGADRPGSIMRVGVVSHSSSEESLNTFYAAGRKATTSCTVQKNTLLKRLGLHDMKQPRVTLIRVCGHRERGQGGRKQTHTLGMCTVTAVRRRGLRKQGQKQTAGGRQLWQPMFS